MSPCDSWIEARVHNVAHLHAVDVLCGARTAGTDEDDARLLLHVALRCAHTRDGRILEDSARDAGAQISSTMLVIALAIANQDLSAHPDDSVLQRAADLLEDALHRIPRMPASERCGARELIRDRG